MSEYYPILPNIHFNANDIPTDDYDMVEWIEQMFPCAEPEWVLWVMRTLLPKSLHVLVLEWLMLKEILEFIDPQTVPLEFCYAVYQFIEKTIACTAYYEAKHANSEEPFYVFYFARLMRDHSIDYRNFFLEDVLPRKFWIEESEKEYPIEWSEHLGLHNAIKEIYEEYQRVLA